MRAIILIASILLAGPQTGGWGLGGNPRPGGSAPFFAAFTRSGAGTSGPCSTTNPTGSRGEALTFTRASSATCQKTNPGTATTGIANGDLVVLSSNQLRAEYGADGILGFRIEESRTNLILRSQEFENAAWTKYAFGSGSAPTVTADYAMAPDGTMTADRVQFSAVNAGDQSGVLQASGVTTGSNTVSLYVRGTSGSGSICLVAYISGGSYSTCNYVAGSWTRCTYTGTVTSSGTLRFGNDSAVCGGGAMSAQDVIVWGAQWENAVYPTSYIPTTSATVNRVADGDVSFSGVSLSSLASSGSSSATITPLASSGQSGAVIVFDTAGRAIYSGGPNMRIWDGTTEPNAAAGYSAGTAKRYWSTWSGATKSITNATDAMTVTDAFDGAMNTTGPLRIGSAGVIGYSASWIITDTCLDQSTSRCR